MGGREFTSLSVNSRVSGSVYAAEAAFAETSNVRSVPEVVYLAAVRAKAPFVYCVVAPSSSYTEQSPVRPGL